MWSKHSRVFCLAGILFFVQLSYSQKDVDSILRIANKQIYENPEEAISLGTNVLENSKITIRNKINALLVISTAHSSKRDYEKGSEYIEAINKLIPQVTNDLQKMNILNRIGAHYQELQIYDKALEYLDESLVLIEKYPVQDSVQSFLGYNSILRGFIYRKQTNCAIALKYFDNAIAAYLTTIKRKPIMHANLSICYYNKGNCLLEMNDLPQAKSSFLKSIEHAKIDDAISLIAFGKKGLAETETHNGNHQVAILLLNEALSISINVGDLVLNREIYEGLANNYLAIGDYKRYKIYQNKYVEIKEANKLAERKTINQSLLNLTQARASEIEKMRNYFIPIQVAFILAIVFILGFLIRAIIGWEKELKKLENKLKN
tara:strand:- start:80428 stop:81552 length:1125 start_codon:yes stop_codon:yes gene_type:complete